MTTASMAQAVSDNNVRIAQKLSEIYEAALGRGYEKGYREGYETGSDFGYHNGFGEGKQAEYDSFWDAFQDYGRRTNWRNGCSGEGWNDETFKPKYPFAPDDSYMMFSKSGITHLPVEVDFSKTGSMQYCFQMASALLELPTIRNGGSMYGAFNGCTSLHTIEKIVLLKPITGNGFNGTFTNCTALVNIAFEGENIEASISFQPCAFLSHDSIVSVINNLSTTASGQTATFSKTAVNNAFEGGSEGAEWKALIGTKSNWTISLV